MKNFKKDLNDVAKTAKALAQKIEKLQKQYAEMEKKHPKMPTKKAIAKKVVRKVPAKKTVKPAAKKPAAKKQVKPTAIDTVLRIINRTRKGVDVAGLKKKTGYDAPKIYRAVKALKKKGKIKTTGIGVYVKA